MYGLLLDKKSPIYGMADEVIKLEPITVGHAIEALGVDAPRAVEEYSVWGGIPRYWELRRDYPNLKSAIKNLILDSVKVPEKVKRVFIISRTACSVSYIVSSYPTNLYWSWEDMTRS